MMIRFKGAHVAQAIMLPCVRWSVADPPSDRPLEERRQARGVIVDHSTIKRWVLKYSPPLEAALHRRKRPVWLSWRMDETDIRIRGHWRDLDRAIDRAGHTIDCLIAAPRDRAAALRFPVEAIRRPGGPATLTVDGREAHASAMRGDHEAHGTTIRIRQVRDRNHVVEQDHRAVERITHPMWGCKSVEAARCTWAGIERMPMWRTGRWTGGAEQGSTAAEQFCALAAS
jgi:putative transposase